MNDRNKSVLNLKSSNFGFVSDFDIRISVLYNKKGQSILEYSILLGVIVMVFLAMGPMIKRGTQSLIKVVADQVGTQQNADQSFDERGHMDSSDMATRGSIDKQTFDTTGMITYVYDDVTTTEINTVSNLGFTREQ